METITTKLNSMRSRDSLEGLVGIDKCIKNVKSLLFTSSSTARTVGIWGIGGLDKTTLACAVYELSKSKFLGHCLLRDIRRNWEKDGATYLRDEPSERLLKKKASYMSNIDLVKKKLHREKLLIVLDDVDNSAAI